MVVMVVTMIYGGLRWFKVGDAPSIRQTRGVAYRTCFLGSLDIRASELLVFCMRSHSLGPHDVCARNT